jgi:nucleotide-binding universal stress UspA family protein
VVGIVPRTAEAVVARAVIFAERFGAALAFVTVDPSRYPVHNQFGTDPLVEKSLPIDPDVVDIAEKSFDPAMYQRLGEIVPDAVPGWSAHLAAGDPARALATIADRLDASMIVVGTREPTLRASLREFFGGSVAAHLAHRQNRPVVVVPLSPVRPHEDLPWDEQA